MGDSFKANLREMLDYRDMSVKELSFKTAIPKRTIENYLNARASIPPADYACRIARALNTTVEYLVEGSQNQNETTTFESVLLSDEKNLIQNYHHLLKKDKAVVLRIAQALAQH